MTASVGVTVERTLSVIGGKRTGLRRLQPHEAGCQDFGKFGEVVVRRIGKIQG